MKKLSYKELDTFFWSEIDLPGAISSGKLNVSLNRLQGTQCNNLHLKNETVITELDEAGELKLEIRRLIEAGTPNSDVEIAIL